MSFGIPLLRVTFLGTSAAQPTVDRNLSGIAVKAGTDLLLFDCGEGSQRQMARFATGFDIDAVFFTHFHADHYLGIIGFLRTLGIGGREQPMSLYGPPPAKRLLHQALHLGVDQLAFPVEIHEPPESPLATLLGIAGFLAEPLATAGIMLLFVVFVLLQREDLRDRFIGLFGSKEPSVMRR